MAKKKFGNEYEIQYECVLDHNAYEYLRVSIEVDRANPTTRGVVCLNGRPIGLVEYLGKRRFKATRNGPTELGEFKDLGLAAAKIITDVLP